MNSRRSFIKNSSISALGMGLLPQLQTPHHLLDTLFATGFPRSAPELQGISSEGISRFIAAANGSGLGWHSFMLLRHGYVVAEGWWKPFDASFKHTMYSLSKSFTGTAIGLLVKDGKLDIDAAVASFFPDEVPAMPTEHFSRMKVRHLLTMNTGHAEDTMPKLRASTDTWTKTFLAQPVDFEPGTHFLYNTGATYMLGAIVYKITGQTLAAFLGPRLFQPLGIKDYDWETSPQGLNTAGYGLRIKTEDIARLGQLYLQKGKWNGKEILTANWVKDATSYQTKSQEGTGDWSQGYGYQFWRCKPGFYRGDGAYGQFCIVMPEQDVVMAVTSESFDMQKTMTTIWENILPAIQPAALPANAGALANLQKELAALVLPVTKGSVSSTSSARYGNKHFKLDKNDYGATETGFMFTKDGCYWSVMGTQGKTSILFGWENWQVNKETALYLFPVPGRIHVASKIAGAATWINDQTLQLNARFIEAMHGDTITCAFKDDTINISFLNSVAEHSEKEPEKRSSLIGKI